MFSSAISFEEWITQANHSPELGVLSAIRINHVSYSEQGVSVIGDEVASARFEQGKMWAAKEVAAFLQGKCQVYAQNLRGTQTFKVFAFYGQEEPTNFHFITATGRGISEGETFEANERGQRAQGMAMGNMVVQRAFDMQTKLWAVAESLLTRYYNDANHYHEESRRSETIILELVREKVSENHTQKMRELEYERSTSERQKFITLLPALIRHITGDRSIVPDSVADTAILETAALAIRKMPPEQQTAVMTQLVGVSSELAMILGGRLQEIGEKQRREEEALRLLAQSKSKEDLEKDESLAKELLGLVNGSVPALNG